MEIKYFINLFVLEELSTKEGFNVNEGLDIFMKMFKNNEILDRNNKFYYSILDDLNKFKKEHEGNKKIEALIQEEISILIGKNQIIVQIYQETNRWYGVTNPKDEEIIKEQLKQLN